jgi:hypothetical protein
MQLTSLRTRLRAVQAACLVLALCQMGVASTKPTLVEVWNVGDDVYTRSLRDALERAFRLSPDFTLSYGKKPGTLVVLIPTNVDWRKIGTRTKVLYAVEFRSIDEQSPADPYGARKINAIRGSCWDDELAKCAAHIVRDAKIAARKIHKD